MDLSRYKYHYFITLYIYNPGENISREAVFSLFPLIQYSDLMRSEI